MWKKPPPVTKKRAAGLSDGETRKIGCHTQGLTVGDKLLKGIVSYNPCMLNMYLHPIHQRHEEVYESLLRHPRRNFKNHACKLMRQFRAEFSCPICRKVMAQPLTTPCAHNFCKPCLEGAFSGQTFVRQRKFEGWRTLRAQKNILRCPSCSSDISDFLQNPQVQL